MKNTQAKVESTIKELYSKLGLDKLANEPYSLNAQLKRLQKFSLYTDNNQYYASGDTRTDR